MESVEITAKEKIYNTAKQLYLENGFENTPITLIAKEAGVTLGLVTYYYKTKDIIASDMLNLNFETLYAHLIKYLPENDGLLQFVAFNQLHFKLVVNYILFPAQLWVALKVHILEFMKPLLLKLII